MRNLIKFFCLILFSVSPALVFCQELEQGEILETILENQEALIFEVHTLNLTLSDMQAQNSETGLNVESIQGTVAFVLIASALSFGSLLFLSYSPRR